MRKSISQSPCKVAQDGYSVVVVVDAVVVFVVVVVALVVVVVDIVVVTSCVVDTVVVVGVVVVEVVLMVVVVVLVVGAAVVVVTIGGTAWQDIASSSLLTPGHQKTSALTPSPRILPPTFIVQGWPLIAGFLSFENFYFFLFCFFETNLWA